MSSLRILWPIKEYVLVFLNAILLNLNPISENLFEGSQNSDSYTIFISFSIITFGVLDPSCICCGNILNDKCVLINLGSLCSWAAFMEFLIHSDLLEESGKESLNKLNL